MGTQGTFTITIDAPPDEVWPWVADVTRHGDYSPNTFTAELVSGEHGDVGARYRSVGVIPNDKHHANDVEVVESVPNERLLLRSDDKLGSFTNTYVLRPVGGGTEVSWTLAFPPLKGPMALMVPILFPLVGKPDGRKRMKLLKAKVESAS
jgi:uncharacterized protein YndB with AHSA1/START domain